MDTYDLSTLDIENIKLADIPNFTAEDESKLKGLQEKLKGLQYDNQERRAVHSEIGRLLFLKAADINRDFATDEWENGFEEEDAIKALQCMARAILIGEGKERY